MEFYANRAGLFGTSNFPVLLADNFGVRMSLLPTNALANLGHSFEVPAGTNSKNGPSIFEKAQMRNGVQSEQTDQKLSFAPPAASVSSVSLAAVATFTPKVEFTGNALSVLSTRVAAMEQTGNSTPLRNRLALLETQFRQTGDNMQAASGQTDPLQLLKLQQDIYQIDEELELLSKVVEQTTSGIKSVLQTQI